MVRWTRIKSRITYLFAGSLIACTQLSNNHNNKLSGYEAQLFKEYWYAGKAEVNSYSLIQSRYGENREGKAVLIFVTEDFSKNKQVKIDDPKKNPSDKISVLKMNFTKSFVTGIYPYSMMLSAFTPINLNQSPHTLKLSMSIQEWCGQVYAQVNLKNKQYLIAENSYFESEGDRDFTLAATLLEDELWNLVRLQPESLPIGKINIIPGLFYTRLNHEALTSEVAICMKEERDEVVHYQITYPDQNRSLTILFQNIFPHTIQGWVETFQQNGKTYTTSAVLDKQLITDYWNRNKNEFLYLRDSLNLSRKNQ
ncbi:MAG: hypothetical protein JNM78_16130 [Cyclobacteriaceae bacterium]|nr:hypothetical protein [Cyclobacteriaceae bacterium]